MPHRSILNRPNVLLAMGWYVHEINVGVARYARSAGWILDDLASHSGTLEPDWSGDGIITLVEDATITVGATALAYNRNRLHPDESQVVIKTGGTLSDGVTIATLFIPTNSVGQSKLGAAAASAEEHVLQRSTTYVLNFANAGTSASTVGFDIFWYEEVGA